jgi:hypothetical protein
MPYQQTVTLMRSAFKTLFYNRPIAKYSQGKQPFLEWITKKTDFYGDDLKVPLRYSPNAGVSNTFQDAQEQKGGSKYDHFLVTRRHQYLMASISREAIEASEKDVGAFVKAKAAEMEASMERLAQQIGADLQGDGSGLIGTLVSASTANNNFVVGDADIVHFEPRMRLVFYTSGGVLRPGTAGYGVVSAVDYDSNTVTLSAADGDTVTQLALAAGGTDLVYPKGSKDYALQGTLAWLPQVRTGLAVAFNNMVRSVFPSRMAGIFFDGSTYGMAEALERAMARARKEQAMPEVIWLNFTRFADLSLELGAKCVREPFKNAGFAYDSIKLSVGGREVRVLADQNFADNTALALTKNTLELKSLKAMPRILNESIVEAAADGIEIRYGWDGNLLCNSPGENVRIKLPT